LTEQFPGQLYRLIFWENKDFSWCVAPKVCDAYVFWTRDAAPTCVGFVGAQAIFFSSINRLKYSFTIQVNDGMKPA
jgi:hypothetical protein